MWPLYVAVYRYPRLRRDLADGIPTARLRAYGEGIAIEWILVAITLGLWLALGRSVPDIGLGVSAGWRLWVGVAVLIVIVVLLTVQRHKILREEELQEQLEKTLVNVSPMLPTDTRELAFFHALSITAGICEEIIYRGYVLWYIVEVTGMIGGVLLSSALFGLAHAYQGTRGMIQTGMVGLVLAVLFILTGTLWVPIILHIFLDINSGRLAYGVIQQRAMRERTRDDAGEPPEVV